MKRTFIILILTITYGLLPAQETGQRVVLTAKEKKDSIAERQYQLNKYMLDNRDLVLEANYLQDRRGNRRIVNSTINFVAIDSTTAIIQVGSDYRNGPNGVGGVTAKGKITRWVVTENKKQRSFNLSINVMTSIGFYDLFFSIGLWGNSTAILTGMSAGQLTFEGDVEPYSASRVYEGRSL